MSSSATVDGSSEMISARRTESMDAMSIGMLVTPSTDFLFGRVNVINLIERALLAVTLSNEIEDVLGHAVFLDYPNIHEVGPDNWVDWLTSTFEVVQCNSLNAVFMHYFVAKFSYSFGCAREIIRTMFNTIPNVHFCLLMVPTGVQPDVALSEIFHEVPRRRLSKGLDSHRLFICHRHQHVPVLHIREARVEDHDDLMPIFARQTDVLVNTYGEYFLAELIEAQNENMKCIVAEVDGTAIGFMSLSKDLNVNLLNDCFELTPFHGLRKPHPSDEARKTFPNLPTSAESLSVDSARSVAGSSVTKDHEQESEAQSEVEEKEEILQEDQSEDLSDISDVISSSGRSGIEQEAVNAHFSETSNIYVTGAEMPQQTADSPSLMQEVKEKLCSKLYSPHPVRRKSSFEPVYFGENNAFSIQLFCIDEKYEMRSCDFLPKAFEMFGDQRYCVITVPYLVPEFPLLQHFTRVTPKVTSTLPQELYIFNALGLLNNITVRFTNKHDFSGIQNLVESLELSGNILSDVKQYNEVQRDDNGTEIQVFVAVVGQHVVGVAVLRREEDIEYIRSHYNIEDFIYFNHHRREEHAHLHHYALNPIFKPYSKYFLKEILRLGNKTCIYYPLFPSYADEENVKRHSLVAVLNEMIPVRARRQIDYPTEILGENLPSERVLKEQQHYALNHINRKLVLEPKVTINARIVVVGASDTGIAFLETFSFSPHLKFNNLTLISPHGLPGEMPPNELREDMCATSHCYSQKDYAQMGLRTWVNVVYGKMTSIDRNKKHVTVDGSAIVPYDHLVLCTGTQYYMPCPTESKVTYKGSTKKKCIGRFEGQLPDNVFLINDSYDAALALCWIEDNVLNSRGKVVIYGNSIDAYSCIQTLLSFGLRGEQIHFVEPPLKSEVTCFNNPEVEKAVTESLATTGVIIHSDVILTDWNYSGEGRVTQVTFKSSSAHFKLDCAAFFSYHDKTVDLDAFRAINCACLVFDGRLVIDANFHTNDPAIRAAGPLTKYKRIYHADRWTHANFNSKEIGIQLASSMQTCFDPTAEVEEQVTEEQTKTIPIYRSPKIQGAVLPGGYKYLHVEKPKLPSPLSEQMSKRDYGQELVTRSEEGNEDYFRLHVNQYNAIETLTCLSKSPYSSSNFLCLYGLHQRYINNLVSRFEEGLIEDFFSYFKESWAMAIFHDRFLDFREEIRELLTTRSNDETQSLEEIIRRMLDEDFNLTEGQRKTLRDRYTSAGYRQTVESRLLSYLTYNHYHLPMYAKPGMV